MYACGHVDAQQGKNDVDLNQLLKSCHCASSSEQVVTNGIFSASISTHVIFRVTYWTRFWSTAQKNRNKQLLKWACRTLETMAMEIFAKQGWSSFKRIDA
jgi:hypothetical protein